MDIISKLLLCVTAQSVLFVLIFLVLVVNVSKYCLFCCYGYLVKIVQSLTKTWAHPCTLCETIPSRPATSLTCNYQLRLGLMFTHLFLPLIFIKRHS